MGDGARIVLLALLLAGVVALLFEGSARRGEAADPWSSYRADKVGTRALFLLLGELGHEVERRHRDLAVLEAGPALLVSVAPGESAPRDDAERSGLGGFLRGLRSGREPFSEHERERLQAWVAEGGRLLLLASRESQLAEDLGLPIVRPEAEPSEEDEPEEEPPRRGRGPTSLEVIAGAGLAGGAERLLARVPAFVEPGEEAEVLVTAAGRPVVAATAFGEGLAVIGSVPDQASNGMLRRADNALLLAALVDGLAQGGRVELDEAHHGLAAGRGITAYLKERGLVPALGQLVLVVVFVLWRLRRRSPSQEPEEEAEAGDPPDLVLALAEAYRKGHHRGHAATRLLGDLAVDLALRYRLGPSRDPDEVATALQARGRPDLAEALRGLVGRRAGLDPAVMREAALLSFARAVARVGEEEHGRS